MSQTLGQDVSTLRFPRLPVVTYRDVHPKPRTGCCRVAGRTRPQDTSQVSSYRTHVALKLFTVKLCIMYQVSKLYIQEFIPQMNAMILLEECSSYCHL